MSICRPGVLRVGDEIRLDGQLQAVVALSGESVRLVDATGATTVVLLPRLLSDPGFALVGTARAPLPPLGVLEGLPGEVVGGRAGGNDSLWRSSPDCSQSHQRAQPHGRNTTQTGSRCGNESSPRSRSWPLVGRRSG